MTKFYFFLCCALAAMLAGYLGGILSRLTPIPGGTMRVNRLEIVDKAGKRRMVLSVDETNEPILGFYNTNEKARISINTLGGNPMLQFYDDAGNMRINLTTVGEKSGLNIDDSTGKTRVSLISSSEGPALRLSNPKGKVQLGCAVFDDSAGFTMNEPDSPGGLLFSASNEGSKMYILASEKKTLWKAP